MIPINLLENLMLYLLDNGITNPRGSKSPDKPDNIVYVNATGGYKPDSDVPITNPTIQFMVRNTDYKQAEQIAWQLYKLFQAKTMYHIKNSYCLSSFALTSPSYGGIDEAGRYIYFVNIRLKLKEE